jgi:peptide/nickel transport system substrate-binding protein
MRRVSGALIAAAICMSLANCHSARSNKGTLTFLIESSPTNLDPRIGTDAQSERIDQLMFDGLVDRGAKFELQPALALSWDHPDPLTWIFHLRPGVHFHDGRSLTSADVKWTLDSMRNGTIVSAKTGAYRAVAAVEAPDPATVVLRMNTPDPSLLWNLSNGALGVVPAGSGRDFAQHLIGTGPFRLVSQEIDKEVVIERAPNSWHPAPQIERVHFAVVPDAITRALELRKGSADLAINSLTADSVNALARDPQLRVQTAPGTVVTYLGFNVRDPILRNSEVRRAIALAINRPLIIQSLLGGRARPASSFLPENHWAFDNTLRTTPYDPAQARQILDAAGYKSNPSGTRFVLTMKTSTDEGTRLLAAVLQQQLRQVGIQLQLRSFEFATFYADIVRGAFQMYSLRWIGGNEDPDIFRYALASTSTPPQGANRGFYSNPQVDALIYDATLSDSQEQRRSDYIQLQQILARDLPVINLWYLDNVLVRNQRVGEVEISPSGDYQFLETMRLADFP